TRPREGRGAGIVAEEPSRLSGTAHPAVLDGDTLHLGDAGNARRLVAPEGLGRVVATKRHQAAAEDCRVLDRHGAACGHVWADRMAGIAEEDDPPIAPAIMSLAIADRHDRDIGCGLDHAANIGVEVCKCTDKILARAR